MASRNLTRTISRIKPREVNFTLLYNFPPTKQDISAEFMSGGIVFDILNQRGWIDNSGDILPYIKYDLKPIARTLDGKTVIIYNFYNPNGNGSRYPR